MTSDLAIRPLTPDLDWDSYLNLTMRSFGPVDEPRVRARIEPIVADGRCLGAFEGRRLVGSALFLDLRQWWHGRPVPMAGVAGVKIAPEDRGRGSAGTTRALWRLVASNSSVAETVRARVGPADPFWWLLREQDAEICERESWMLRLLDAPAAIAARGFPATDLAVPLLITDDLCPANSGPWQLTVRDGSGRLSFFRMGTATSPGSPASAQGEAPEPPLALGPRGLAALYAGTPVATLRRAGLASGGSAVADAALDGAFAATPSMLDSF